MHCTWNISVPSGYSVEMKFKTFDVSEYIPHIMLKMNDETDESTIVFRFVIIRDITWKYLM